MFGVMPSSNAPVHCLPQPCSPPIMTTSSTDRQLGTDGRQGPGIVLLAHACLSQRAVAGGVRAAAWVAVDEPLPGDGGGACLWGRKQMGMQPLHGVGQPLVHPMQVAPAPTASERTA
jgi:hypothetical protein